MNKKFIKKTLAITTSVATTLSVSGISLLMPVFTATAVTINEGDTIKTADSFDVWIVKHMGAKKFRRLILNPQVFESYGHLSWSKIKTVSSAEMAMYTESKLVRAVGDPKVYELSSALNSDTGVKKWVNMTAAEFMAAGNDWDSIYEINTVDRDNYTVSTDITPTGTTPTPTASPTPAPTGTGVTVSLASDTPPANSVAMGAADIVFAKVNFVGGENTTITAITATRSGLANDTDISEVKLWDGATQLGSTQALNSTTHKAGFTGLSWVVPAGLTKVLTITGSIAGTGTAATSTAPRLGIAAKEDITADKTISGTFPIAGNPMTIASLAIGRLDVVVQAVPANQSPISGSTDQEIASWQFSAVNEGMNVRKIKITNTGSAGTADISNIKLKISGAQIGSTIASLASDGTATFDLTTSPVSILSGSNKIIYAHADIASGINTSRTIDFEITNAADVMAIGANSGGSVTITIADGATYTTQSGTAQTISQGTVLSVTTNGATHPSAQTFIRGASQVLVSAFRFSNGAGETQRITRVKLSLGGTSAAATDLSNVVLYKYDPDTGTETQIGSATGFVGTIATYGLNTTPTLDPGLFDVEKNKNYIVHVRSDVTTSAVNTHTIIIFVNEIRVDGVQSKADIGAATITAVDTAAEVMATGHSLANTGTLTMSASPSNPSAQNVVPGVTDFTFMRVDFTMANEAATLSSATVNLYDGAVGTSGAAGTAESGDFTNLKLWDMTTGTKTQLGTTVASPTTSGSFNFNLQIGKDKTVSLAVSADVPTNAYSEAWSASTASVGMDLALTTTGVSSGADITDPSADIISNLMTASVETLTVAFQAVPSTTLIVNASQPVISKTVLAAGTAGDVKVTSIKFTAASTTTLNTGGASSADTEFGTLKLFDGTTQIGQTLSAFTNVAGGDTATFSGLSVTIPKGTSKLLELKANVLASGDGTVFVGFFDLTGGGTATDVVSTGLSSNTTIYGTGTNSDDSGSITLAAAGTLTVDVDAGTPARKFVAVGQSGKTGVELNKVKFSATNEPMNLEKLVMTLEINDDTPNKNDVPDFASLRLYNGTTPISSYSYPSGTNATQEATSTFTFGTWSGTAFTAKALTVAKGGNVVLTMMADMNGTSNGANSTSTPHFFILPSMASSFTFPSSTSTVFTARGVDSGSNAITVTLGSGTKDPAVVGNFNDIVVVRSKPIFALCTASNCSKASPSGQLVPGVVDVLRFRVTAEGDDVGFSLAQNNMQFTVAQSGGTATGRNVNFFEVGKSASLQTVSTTFANYSGVNFGFATTTISIASPSYKEYFIQADLTDYTTTGNTFRLSLQDNTTAPTGERTDTEDVNWDDGTATYISVDAIVDGLPMTGSTLTK